ncbi:MAG: hypothetical protein WDO74_32600 [Pseudomonadota bacterium]
MKGAASVCAAVFVLLTNACYTTRVSSGKPTARAVQEGHDHWHSGVFNGGVDLSGSYDLKRLCPDGWAEIQTKTSAVNELVELLTFGIYAPQTVRVRCASAKAATNSAAW